MITEVNTAMIPTAREIRVPKMIRVKTSRPRSSVPIQWEDDGGRSRWMTSCCNGSTRQKRGAAAASAIRRTTRRAPERARGFRAKRRRKVESILFIPDARIHRRVEEIGDEISQQRQKGRDGANAHDHWIIPGHNGIVA